jgi:hypothetical protein
VSKPNHPTKQALIVTACELLERLRADEIQVDEVLQKSGISKGSLYHHFEDFGELVEEALVQRFVLGSERDIETLKSIFANAADRANLLKNLELVTEQSQSVANRSRRFERAEIISRSQRNPRLESRLAAEQQRVNDEFEELVRLGQSRGWFRPELRSDAVAIFIQAYTLGRLVDDISEKHVDGKNWNFLINQVLHQTLSN